MTGEDPFDHTRMTLGEHLDELRTRLFRGLAAIAITFIASWAFYQDIAALVLRPYHRAAAMLNEDARARAEELLLEHPELERDHYFDDAGQLRSSVRVPQVTAPAEGFLFALKTCLYAALFFGGPVLLWQLWQFIGAGLYPHERRAALRYFPFSVALFLGGVLFGYFLMVPYAFYYLGGAFPLDELQPIYTLSNYFGFLSSLSLALGAVFQLPVLMVFFARLGLVQVATMQKYRGHFIVGAFVIAAILTPPDPVTQLLMAVPMVVLYEIGLQASRVFARPRKAPGEPGTAP